MKPSTDPAAATRMVVVTAFPVDAVKTAMVASASNPTPPANPSSPSMKFIAFTTPTIQKIVTGSARAPR